MIGRSAIVTVVALLSILSFINLSSALKHKICDEDKSDAKVSHVAVNQCESLTEACPFIRGFNKSIELDFTPKKQINQVKVKLVGKLSHLPKPFPVNPENACGNYGFDCPLEANKLYKFNMTLPILRSYPKMNLDVFLRLVDEADKVIACVELPARIQEPQKEWDHIRLGKKSFYRAYTHRMSNKFEIKSTDE